MKKTRIIVSFKSWAVLKRVVATTWYDLSSVPEKDEGSVCVIDVSAVYCHAVFSKLRLFSHVNYPFSRFSKGTKMTGCWCGEFCKPIENEVNQSPNLILWALVSILRCSHAVDQKPKSVLACSTYAWRPRSSYLKAIAWGSSFSEISRQLEKAYIFNWRWGIVVIHFTLNSPLAIFNDTNLTALCW